MTDAAFPGGQQLDPISGFLSEQGYMADLSSPRANDSKARDKKARLKKLVRKHTPNGQTGQGNIFNSVRLVGDRGAGWLFGYRDSKCIPPLLCLCLQQLRKVSCKWFWHGPVSKRRLCFESQLTF